MIFPIHYILFFFSLLLGSLISISSSSWFGAWIGLELNMMSFIPLITVKMNFYYSESALKYFLIQALGSALLIMASFFSLSFFFLASILLTLALLLKLASAPFHFWFPQVMEGLAWPQAFLLMTIQKLAPMILISYLMINSILIKMIIFSAILCAVSGALGGLNITYLRKIMAFSSINHMSWMLIAISASDSYWLFYFCIYFFITFSITFMFHKLQSTTISNLVQSNFSSPLSATFIGFNLLSLGGLPPFTGFVPKWFIIQMMINNNLIFPLFFLLASALITLYFYLRIVITLFTLYNPVLTFNMSFKPTTFKSLQLSLATSFNLIGLLTPFYFFLL
uniref:NADH-ubiquinone oxidoreductase chain 2 n=1 Tax=Metopograpsus frontalis TaxID=1036996 RepID=A0A4D6IVN5_9EUCA|nr:NADH dehydrogenase subunit 2 [Metopograpsus frontalis]QCC70819.1 NADH dehydrogenase subunit 2 [Metopograpsus frontalis]